MNLDQLQVRHNQAAQRFETAFDGYPALLVYHRAPGLLSLDHTEVPPPIARQGVAAKLTQAALEFARAEQLRVVPACSYAAAYIRKHPEYQDLLAPGKR
ncbi:MAG: GNAT family N-acetyltransferase [Candidatus Acidiferrum sp.]